MENNVVSVIDFLDSKKVFIFDTETTGLPERIPGSKWGSPGEYWSYTMNEKYDKSRIISIAWAFTQSFNKSILAKEKIYNYIRFPEGFDNIPTTHIHGISYDMACNSGIPFNDIFQNSGLYEALLNAEYIIAHNVNFDIHILLNELFRQTQSMDKDKSHDNTRDKYNKIIKHINTLLLEGKCICSGELGRNICKINYKTYANNINKINKINKITKLNYKMPKLIELYKYYYGCDFDNAHSADGDVRALLMCLSRM
jgi:DNA polymerase III epsilon subunit-like protein